MMNDERIIDCYPIIVVSDHWYSPTEERAWESFNENLVKELKWTKGYPYWRSPPILETQNNFDTGKKVIRVFARISFMWEEVDVKGLEKAEVLDDYSKCKSYVFNKEVIAFGKEEDGE